MRWRGLVNQPVFVDSLLNNLFIGEVFYPRLAILLWLPRWFVHMVEVVVQLRGDIFSMLAEYRKSEVIVLLPVFVG